MKEKQPHHITGAFIKWTESLKEVYKNRNESKAIIVETFKCNPKRLIKQYTLWMTHKFHLYEFKPRAESWFQKPQKAFWCYI